MENNTAIMENNTTVTGNNTAVTGNNKALIENNTAISENNTGVTDNGTVVTGNDTEVIKSNTTISENNKAVTDRCTVVAGNDTVAIENNTGLTDRNTAVAQDIEKRTDMEKQSSETKRDTNLISSFSNLTVTDPTSVENPEIQKEGKLKCTENADPKLLTANAKEDRKADSHIQPAVGNDLKGETGAVSNNKACGAWHSEGNTKQAHDRLLDLKVNEAGGDSGIVLDGEASEATFPKTTCEDLPNQSRYEQESTTENIANFSSETVPKTIDSEATNTVLVQKVVVTKEDTGEIASENVMDTVDQSHFTQQMSTLSMDEGVQGDNEKVQQQILQEVKKQAGLQQLSEKRQQQQEQHHGQQYGQQQQQQDGQHQLGHLHHHQQQQQQQQPYEQTPHGQQQQQQKQQQHHQRYHHQQYSPCLQNQQHLLMKNLQEPQMASGSSQISSPQDYVNTFSRFDSPQIGGAGAVNVFSGGHLTVGSLSINPPPQTSPGIAVPLSTVFEGDGVIIYTDDDYDIAIGFKEHLENDFPSLDIKVDLFDLIDVNLTLYASLETVLYKYRFVFIIITANLNKDKVKSRANEDFQESTFHEEWKRDRIIPVHVFPLKDSKKFCPMMFRSVKGMQYYQRKSTGYAKKMYEDSVKMQIQRVREKSREWEAMIIKEHKNKRSQS